MNIYELQSQVFNKLTLEERKAMDEMWLENFRTVLEFMFDDLKKGVPTALIQPTPLPELNKFIQSKIAELRGE